MVNLMHARESSGAHVPIMLGDYSVGERPQARAVNALKDYKYQKDTIKRTLYIDYGRSLRTSRTLGTLTSREIYHTSYSSIKTLEVLESLVFLYIKSNSTKNKVEQKKVLKKHTFFYVPKNGILNSDKRLKNLRSIIN